MPILYTDIDKKFWFRQPNFIRWRHMFRSPRNSLKINQEMGQTHYDLARINVRVEDVTELKDELIDKLYGGWDLDDEITYDWNTDATPYGLLVDLPGIDEMATRVEALRNRIRNLED